MNPQCVAIEMNAKRNTYTVKDDSERQSRTIQTKDIEFNLVLFPVLFYFTF